MIKTKFSLRNIDITRPLTQAIKLKIVVDSLFSHVKFTMFTLYSPNKICSELVLAVKFHKEAHRPHIVGLIIFLGFGPHKNIL